MSSDTRVFPEIDVEALENELRELWRRMAEDSRQEGGQALTKACVQNLVVWAPGQGAGTELSANLAEVTSEHPSRLLLLLPEADSSLSSLSARVTVQCQAAGRGRKQVCCEQITVKAEGERIPQLVSVVRPLLVPDLPVVLYWRDTPDPESRMFLQLVAESSRVILDTRKAADATSTLARLSQLIQDFPHAAFTDLSWASLTPWRRLIAGFYDVPGHRKELERVAHLELECGRSYAQQRLPAEPLLLTFWMAGRLGWHPAASPIWLDQNHYQVRFKGPRRNIVAEIQLTDSPPGPHSVLLATGAEPATSFHVATTEDGAHLEAYTQVGGVGRAVEKLSRTRRRSESYLLARELEVLGHDRVFQQTLSQLREGDCFSPGKCDQESRR
ncbi:MAG: glucose-6-phosphate dehydrogenase assembly protein OpcA [Acidobacteriota bacterium]